MTDNQTPLPSRLRSNAGRIPTARSTPARDGATRNLASPAGQGSNGRLSLLRQVARILFSPEPKPCRCDDPRLNVIGGFKPGCPVHDPEAATDV